MSRVVLRLATLADSSDLLTWRNDVTTRNMAINQGIINQIDHDIWLNKVLNDSNRKLFIIEEDWIAKGSIRLDINKKAGEISIGLAPAARGNGLGGKAIAILIATFPDLRLIAQVKESNIASIKTFEKAGFKIKDKNRELIILKEDLC